MAPSPPSSGGRWILSLLIQGLLVFSINEYMLFCIYFSKFLEQSIIDSRYPRCDIRKGLDIIRFPIVDMISFLQIVFFLSVLFLS